MIDKRENDESMGIQCIGTASAILLKHVSEDDSAKCAESCRHLHYNNGNSWVNQEWDCGVFTSNRCIALPAFDTCGESVICLSMTLVSVSIKNVRLNGLVTINILSVHNHLVSLQYF